MPEETAAHKAIKLVYGDRPEQYGHPTEVYERTARLWSGYLGVNVGIRDVALMMVLFKLGREMNKPSPDNVVDAHGYLLVYERILKREAEESDSTPSA